MLFPWRYPIDICSWYPGVKCRSYIRAAQNSQKNAKSIDEQRKRLTGRIVVPKKLLPLYNWKVTLPTVKSRFEGFVIPTEKREKESQIIDSGKKSELKDETDR